MNAESNPADAAKQPADAKDNAPEPKEPSLGPACLVIAILAMAIFCIICGLGSFLTFRDQYPLAEQSITRQLIPWVQSSQLAADDKRQIVAQLQALIPRLQAREISTQQLTRLHYCLQDNPVLLWGGVQSILAQAATVGLTETELAAVERISQRLLWMATDRQLSRRDLEFTLQNCATVREDGTTIEVRDDLSADEIRNFMTRAEQLFKNHDVPNQAYDKSPAEAFAILIDKALDTSTDVVPET